MTTEIRAGSRVAARDASGRWLAKIAAGRPHMGGDFAVVDVCWTDGPPGDTMPWPLEDVVPIEDAPERPLSHAEYRAQTPTSESAA